VACGMATTSDQNKQLCTLLGLYTCVLLYCRTGHWSVRSTTPSMTLGPETTAHVTGETMSAAAYKGTHLTPHEK
jgi:hypothetical protein